MSDRDEEPRGQVFRLVKSGEGVAGTTLPTTVLQSNAAEPEDEFQSFYMSATGQAQQNVVLAPPFTPNQLERRRAENNALEPCIAAMVTNIDGTGYTFEPRDPKQAVDTEDDANIKALNDFFDQPWPGMSFRTIRLLLRRDMETTGNAYLEVIRTPDQKIAFFRHVDAKMIRLVRLDDAVPVAKTLRRAGKDVTIRVMERERRFAQLLNGKTLLYFKAFGASRDLNKATGKWSNQGQQLPAPQRATEIIHFTLNPDANSPYGLPRWISQMPSVLGSRKAEEFNLEYFEAGGVPPVMLLIQGGSMTGDTRKAIQDTSRGAASKVNRMQVIEVDPGGSLDKPSTARIQVERFGSERQSDSMFEGYDEKCEQRVRRAFRLPPIFVGQAGDYSFATAYASYTVAEAQVFQPEREEFDEIISIKLLPAMGYPDYKLKSQPLSIEDATLKLDGIQMALGAGTVKPEDVLEEINVTVGTKFKADPEAVERQKNTALGLNPDGSKPEPVTPVVIPKPGANPASPTGTPKKPAAAANSNGVPAKVAKGDWTGLALDLLTAIRKRDTEVTGQIIPLLGSLGHEESQEFTDALARLQFEGLDHDPTGLAELASCTVAMMGNAVGERVQ